MILKDSRMLNRKETFICKICGRKFTESVPDFTTDEFASLFLFPLCRIHRKKKFTAPKSGFGCDTDNIRKEKDDVYE